MGEKFPPSFQGMVGSSINEKEMALAQLDSWLGTSKSLYDYEDG